MAEVGSVFVSVVPSMKGFSQTVAAEGNAAGSKFSSGFKLAAFAGLTVAAAKVGQFIGDAIGEAREAEKVGRATEQLVKNQGSAATVSAAAVGKLSTAISNKTGIDDEAIQSGQNLLLSFQSVQNQAGKGNAVFDRASAAIVDLGVKMKTGPEGAAKVLGKALNDPVKGMAALTKAGAPLTASQQAQVKAFVAAGDTLSAQKVILTAVESKVGGLAATSATGAEKMGVAWGNLKERFGLALTPAIDAVSNALTPLIQKVTSSTPAMIAIAAVVGGILVGAFAALAVSAIAATWPFLLIGIAVAAVVAALIFAWTHFETFRTVVTFVLNAVVAVVKTQIAIIVAIIKTGVKVAVAVFDFFKAIPGVVSGAWDAVKSATTTAWNATLTFIQGLPGKIIGFFKALPENLKQIGTDIVNGFLAGIEGAWHFVTSKVESLIAKIPLAVRKMLGIASPSKVFAEIGWQMGMGLVTGMDRSGSLVEAATGRLVPSLATGSVHSSVGATSASAADRPIRMADGTLFGWVRGIANGEAELVLNNAVFASTMGAR